MRASAIGAIVVALLVVAAPICFGQGWDTDDLWTADRAREMPTQSWFGSTGMLVIPTAEVLGPNGISAHAHYIDLEESDDWEAVFGANVSIIPGLEAGLTQLSEALTGTDSDETLFQAKYVIDLENIVELGPEAPALAIGGRDLGDELNRTYYVVMTKDFMQDEYTGNAVTATIGFGDSENGGDTPLDGIFGGVDVTPFEFARLQLEHDGENFNAVLRYAWSEWAVTEIGALDGDLGIGVSLQTGF